MANKEIYPNGDFDRAGRWYPSRECDGCGCIRTPSRDFPHSLLAHSKTVGHVSSGNNAEESDVLRLRKYLNSISKSSFSKVFTKLSNDERSVVLEKFGFALLASKTNAKFELNAEDVKILIADLKAMKTEESPA